MYVGCGRGWSFAESNKQVEGNLKQNTCLITVESNMWKQIDKICSNLGCSSGSAMTSKVISENNFLYLFYAVFSVLFNKHRVIPLLDSGTTDR